MNKERYLEIISGMTELREEIKNLKAIATDVLGEDGKNFFDKPAHERQSRRHQQDTEYNVI